jgi:ABC-type nitrate/sulfonate/bicarbonate transport system substrate-binding protein
MSRRAISRGVWLLCAWLACVATEATPATATTTKLAVAKVANDFALMMVDYGNALGSFKKQGLDVEVSQITQAKMIQAVVAGSIDMALASGTTLAYVPKGAPLTGVAALSGPPSILVLIVRADGALTAINQLHDRTVAVTNIGSLTDWAVSQIAVSEKWPLSAIKRVAVGDTPARVAALRTGAVDAAVIDIAAALDLEQRGEAKILINFGDLITAFQNQIIFSSNKLIQTNPDAVRGFLRAWFDTLDFARAHKGKTVAFAQKALAVTPAVAERVYDALMPTGFFSQDGRFDRKVLNDMSKAFLDLRLINQEVNLSQYVTDQFLPKAQ